MVVKIVPIIKFHSNSINYTLLNLKVKNVVLTNYKSISISLILMMSFAEPFN